MVALETPLIILGLHPVTDNCWGIILAVISIIAQSLDIYTYLG